MLIFLVTLIAAVLDTTIGVEYQSLSANLTRSRRGIVEVGHNAQQDYKYRQPRYHNPMVQNTRTSVDNVRSSTSPKSSKISPRESSLNGQNYGSPTYEDVFKRSPSQANSRQSGAQSREQSLPYFDKLFTMTASYKVAGDKVKPSKQVAPPSRNQNSGIEGTYGTFPSFNNQLPLYKSNYPSPKSADLQTYAPVFHTNPYSDINNEKKASLPVLRLQNTQDLSSYLTSFQSQPFLSNPTDYRFSFVGKTPKVNNVQSSSPFLSPASSFQSQVVPISTALNSPQFPQYKGASIQVYPSVAGFSTTAYQPLRTQPQLHFGHDAVHRFQPVEGARQSAPAEEIRADVEIIDKIPTTPPPKKHDEDDDEDDEGYTPNEKEYRPNTEGDEEYEDKPDRYFNAPRTEGNFKPSTTFPFKQYDEKFGKYSSQKHKEEADDDDSEKILSSKYQSKDTSSRPYYSRQEEAEEEDDDGDDGRSYEKQKTEESSEDTYRPKYFNKNYDEDFEAPYRKELPQERYVRTKESLRSDESEDPSNQENRMSFKYHKAPHDFQDNEGRSSDNVGIIISKVTQEDAFGYRIPE